MFLSKDIATYLAIKRTIKKINKNYELAFKIGKELSIIYYKIYINLRSDDLLNFEYIYNIISSIFNYNDFVLSKIINQNIDYSRYFSKINIKLLQLDIKCISVFMRGYYLNDMTSYSTNITCKDSNIWFVLYDNQYHYLLFIYNYLNNNYTSSYIKLLLNDKNDTYSINDESNELQYKLIFQKNNYDFIDSIKLILDFFYKDIIATYNEDDAKLYRIYKEYEL